MRRISSPRRYPRPRPRGAHAITDRDTILHITSAEQWAAAQARGAYEGDTLATEGFIHCSRPDQLATVARVRFPDPDGFVVLVIDRPHVGPEIVDENLEGGRDPFPHIYGPLNLDAVRDVITLAAFLTSADAG